MRRIDFSNIRKRVSLTLAASLPLFLLFASVGEVERGMVATFLAYIAASAFQLGWGRRRQIWFWCIGAAMIVGGIVLVLGIDWPHLDTFAGLMIGYAAATAFGLLWYALFMVARRLERDRPGEAPIRCRVCKLPVDKGEVRCSHCGEWAPGPVPRRPILVALSPLAIVAATVAVIRILDLLTPPPTDVALPAGTEIASAAERNAARQFLKDRRFACVRLRSLQSGGVVHDSKLWIAVCERPKGPPGRYAIYPATGFVKACDDGVSCE